MEQVQERSGVAWGYRAVSVLTALMVLAQPILAGQFMFGIEPDLKDVHAINGQSLHITVLAQLILAFIARQTFGIGLSVLNLVLLVLITIQAGIGFSDDRDLLAIHVPLGTVLLTLATFAAYWGLAGAWGQRRAE